MGELYQNIKPTTHAPGREKRRPWSCKIHSEDEFVNITSIVLQTVTRPMNNLTHLELEVFSFFSKDPNYLFCSEKQEEEAVT